jgi:hypothetical protein
MPRREKLTPEEKRHAALGDGDFFEDGERMTLYVPRSPYP